MPRPNRKRKAVFTVLCIILLCIGTSGASLGAEISKPKGFLADLSESHMSWTDAKSYCASRGGRLPRINDATSLTFKQGSKKGKPVDVFGTIWGKWPPGLPHAVYWTDTEAANSPGSSFVVGISENGRKVSCGVNEHGENNRVVCVPVGTSNIAPAAK